MSEEAEVGMNGSKDDICRDFLRNVCHRGNLCKYRHPDKESGEIGKTPYEFCHDYQNKGCTRINCKFIHCNRQEEEYYQHTGQLPPHVMEQVNLPPTDVQSNPGDIPICKDFLNGDCKRQGRCKFKHVYRNQVEMGASQPQRSRVDRYDAFAEGDRYERYEPEPKRRAVDDYYMVARERSRFMPAPPISREQAFLEEENSILRQKVDDLKKQVQHLMATNEFLLEQNAQLRLGKPSGIISISGNDLNATQQRIATELAAAPAQMVSSVSLASVPQSIISGASTSLVSYPIMTQSMRPVIPTNLGR